MAEWLKAHAWKACIPLRVSWVRIPLSPPDILFCCLLPDAEAASADERRRAHREHFVRPHPRVSVPGSSVYGAAEGAIEVLTRYLAKDLARDESRRTPWQL